MDDDVVKTCASWNTKKCKEYFHKEPSEYNSCIFESVLKRYYITKDEISQQRRNNYACFEDLDNRLKALEEKLSVFDLTIWFDNHLRDLNWIE